MATTKHKTMVGCRYLIARRIQADGTAADEPNLVVDWQGATVGSIVIVSTDGDIARTRFGNTTPIRMVVVGIVDAMHVSKVAGGNAG